MQERKLTKPEAKAKERIVKDLKGAKAEFKKRYGKDAEAVMYATATKRAKKIAEDRDLKGIEVLISGLRNQFGINVQKAEETVNSLSDENLQKALQMYDKGKEKEAIQYTLSNSTLNEAIDPALMEKIAAGLLLILGPVGIKLGFDQLIKLGNKYVAPAIDKFYGKIGAGAKFLSKNLPALKDAAKRGKEALEIKLQDLLMVDKLNEDDCGCGCEGDCGQSNIDIVINELIEDLVYEELCKRGKAYIAARKRAGEKSSAYLSGRAVKVCKGQIRGVGGKRKKSYRKKRRKRKRRTNEALYQQLRTQTLRHLEETLFNDPHFAIVAEYNVKEANIDESLRDWFKKEKWVRIDTQGNIAGKCGTMPKGKATQRCLPRAKAQSLTKAQRRATARKKVRGSKKGKQFVRNTKKAKVSFKKK